MAGFVYGLLFAFRIGKAVYTQMVVFAVGCLAFGRLYQLIRLLVGEEIHDIFQLGIFGVIGSLLFLFSANFGTINNMIDTGGISLNKYRLISMTAPLCAAASFVIFISLRRLPTITLILGIFVTVFVMQASYFSLKHLIIPDVERGFIWHLRSYNLIALIYEFLCLADMIAVSCKSPAAVLIIDILLGIGALLLPITIGRAVKKWKI
mgnify:CR=1 FL=1